MASTRFRRGVAIVALLVLFVVAMACVTHNVDDGLLDGDAGTGEGDSKIDDGGAGERERAMDGDELDESVACLVEGLGEGEQGQWTTRRTNDEIDQAAAGVLRLYRDEGDCVLCESGYVDLFGRVWSCVVQGPGWVDLCVISQAQDGAGSEVRSLRMAASEWRRDDGNP